MMTLMQAHGRQSLMILDDVTIATPSTTTVNGPRQTTSRRNEVHRALVP